MYQELSLKFILLILINDPQYEIKSDKTNHVAAHKGSALSKPKKMRFSSASLIMINAVNCLDNEPSRNFVSALLFIPSFHLLFQKNANKQFCFRSPQAPRL